MMFLTFDFSLALTVGKPKEFEVDVEDAGGKSDLKVTVTSPSGKKVPLEEESGVLPKCRKLKFTPEEEGL